MEELFKETKTLGETLRLLSDRDPCGTPTESASRVFSGWVAAAGPVSLRPLHFADVGGNYNALENSNKDLWDIFSLLESYIEFPEPEPPAPKTFIGLPLIQDDTH